MGLTGYYRRFIEKYAHLAAPLTDLLRKDNFHWNELTQTAFNQLKERLITTPVFIYPDFSFPFIIETDACDVGVGAILMQRGHPIAYYSKKLSPLRQRTSTYAKELWAITDAVQKWRHYLWGNEFTIRTYHRSLKNLLAQPIQTPEQQFFLTKLLGYKFHIEYKKGKENGAVDALSRMPSEAKDGLIFFKNRFYIGPESNLRNVIMEELHGSRIGGHASVFRTLARIRLRFFWKGMTVDIKRFIQQCRICQQGTSQYFIFHYLRSSQGTSQTEKQSQYPQYRWMPIPS